MVMLMGKQYAIAGLLTGGFMAASAAAQDFSRLEFKQAVQPYSDLNISIIDMTDPAYYRSGRYTLAYRSCQANSQSAVLLYQWPEEAVSAHAMQTRENRLGDLGNVTQFALSADGTFFNLDNPAEAEKVADGAIQAGLSPTSAHLSKVVEEIARGCAPQF